MNQKLLVTLAAAAALAVGVAVWLSGQRAPAPEAAVGGPLVEGLADSVNNVSAVMISDGDSEVNLSRRDGHWVLTERDGYRADLSQLRKRLVALVEAKKVEQKTANPERYSLLGVSDVSADDNDDNNQQVVIKGDDSTGLALDLIVGKSASNADGTYVRMAGESQSWLASGDLRFSATAIDWLKKDVLDLPPGRIARVELVNSDGDRVELTKAQKDAPNFDLANLPEGREMLSPSAGNSIASALSNLRIEDVKPATAETFQGLEIVQGTFETFDGLRIGTRVFSREDSFYLMLDAAFDESLAVAPAVEEASEQPVQTDAGDGADEDGNFDQPEQAQAAADAASAAAAKAAYDEAVAAARQQAEDLQALVDGWVFEIPSYKHGNLSKGIEDLLKPLADSEDADGE